MISLALVMRRSRVRIPKAAPKNPRSCSWPGVFCVHGKFAQADDLRIKYVGHRFSFLWRSMRSHKSAAICPTLTGLYSPNKRFCLPGGQREAKGRPSVHGGVGGALGRSVEMWGSANVCRGIIPMGWGQKHAGPAWRFAVVTRSDPALSHALCRWSTRWLSLEGFAVGSRAEASDVALSRENAGIPTQRVCAHGIVLPLVGRGGQLSAVPGSATHWVVWPVMEAIMSKSPS
jgi:hypothetical protein